VPSLSQCNESILRALGGDWSAPPVLADGWPADPRLEQWRRPAARLAARHLRRPAVLWKDPRLSLTLPFWSGTIAADAPAVLVVRNPLEVAASLERRDGIDVQTALALWERYVSAALTVLAGRPAYVVRYEDMVQRPDAIAAEARRWLIGVGVTAAGDAQRAASAVRESLRHTVHADADLERDERVTASQRALHRAACRLAGAHESFAPLDVDPPAPESLARLAERQAARRAARDRQTPRRRGRRWVLTRASEMARSLRGAGRH
jgi:hypothetical protein